MRYIRKRCMAYVAAIVLCLSAVLPAQAAQVGGTTTIAVSSSSMEVGDRLTVTVKPSADGTIRLRYNGSVLRLTNCDASGYTTAGSEVTYTGGEATLTFEAVGSGSSGLIVSSDTLTGSSTTVQVADPAATTTTEPQEGSQSQAGETTAQTGGASAQAEGQFTIDGVAYVASERYSASEVPAGFNTVQLEIQGSTYRELSNGQITLVYLKPASNTSGSGTFYIYNEEDQSVSPMILIGTMEDYVIALEPAEVPANLSAATLVIGDRQITAYAVSGNTDNFYYLYGIDENGTEQWYQYDADDGSMQRANTALFAADEGQTNADAASASGGDSDQISRLRIVIAVLIFVAVVLLIAVVNLVLGRRRVRKDVYDAMEDEEESDEAEEESNDADEEVDDADDEFEENEDDDLTYSEDADEDEEDEDVEEWQGFHGINDSVRMDLEDDMEDSRRQEEDDDHVTEELQRELDQLNLRGKEEKKRKDTSEDSGKKNKKKKETDEEEELDFSDLEILDLNDL